MKNTVIITLSDYIKTIRKHSKNTRKSYQEILSILFEIICSNDNSYPLCSASSSRIINREYDIPLNVREAYNKMPESDKRKDSDNFINIMIDPSSLDILTKEIKEQILNSNVSYNIKNSIKSMEDYYEILSVYLKLAITTDNRIHISNYSIKKSKNNKKLDIHFFQN